ncbi:MAG: CPBP family intramembrane metalloprotease [Clostridiales bacterium]|nr:CPBP family intramembrane metalloprotease [Clostridiales bacterium]
MDKRKIIKFVGITLAIAWTIQIIVSIYMVNNPGSTGTLVFRAGLAVCMYVPMFAVLIVNRNLKGMGWKPKFKGNIGWLIFAAYIALPLTIMGAAVFFLIFPDLFDTTGSYLIAQGEAAGVDLVSQLGEAGLTIQQYMLISSISLIYVPFINIVTAIGEEAGWRGFLYPELNKSFGKIGTWIIGGTIWGAFHFPAIILGGYEYGVDYPGKPVSGLIVFTIICIAIGVIEEIIYSRTKCIWYAALFHGSFNGMATIPQLVINANNPDLNKYLILGPMPNGLIAGIPLVALAVIMGVIAVRKDKNKEVSA